MPSDTFQELKLYCGRLAKYKFEIYDLDTQLPVAIAALDEVLAKLSLTLGAASPTLDLTSASGGALAGGSYVQITNRGSVGNLDPDDDTPATGYVWLMQEDTETIPNDDAWRTGEPQKRYWLELIHEVNASGVLNTFGRGRVLVSRSPG